MRGDAEPELRRRHACQTGSLPGKAGLPCKGCTSSPRVWKLSLKPRPDSGRLPVHSLTGAARMSLGILMRQAGGSGCDAAAVAGGGAAAAGRTCTRSPRCHYA
jgi:hypothetical protein